MIILSLLKLSCTSRRTVCKVRHTTTRAVAAMKTVKTTDEYGKAGAEKEICLLRKPKHHNVVELKAFNQETNEGLYGSPEIVFYMVLDFCEFDLDKLIKDDRAKFKLEHIKDVSACFYKF